MIHVSQARLVGEMPLHIPHHRDVDPTNCPYREEGEEWTTSNI